MDNLKKNIKENEERLNIEQVGDCIWTNINRALNSNSKAISTHKNKYDLFKWLWSYNTPYRKWAFALVIPVLFIMSSAYRIKHTEKIGDIVTFNVRANNTAIIQRINSLDTLLGIKLYTAPNVEPHIISFVGFIKQKDTIKLGSINKEINLLNGISKFTIIPVEKVLSESLFSRFVYKVFNKTY